MDPELQKRIDAAKAAGYSDEEIAQSLQGMNAQPQQEQPTATMPNGPVVPILSPEEKARFQQSQQQTEASNTQQNLETGLVTAGMGAAAVGVPYAIYKGARGILRPAVQSGAELAQRGVGAMESANEIARQTEARVAANQAAKMAQAAGPIAATPTPGVYAGQGANVPGAVANEASMASRVQQAAASNIKNLPPPTMLGQAGKFAGRVLPGAGTVLNAADAYNRYQQGDYLGAGIAGIGAAASPFPVVGTAVGLGAGALNAGIDYYKYLQAKKQFEEQQKAMGR